MSSMGSSCSTQRPGVSHSESSSSSRSDPEKRSFRSSLRHSVVSAIPDHSIAELYPVQDNYVSHANGRRSPKSLANLCIDSVCRHLVQLNGELPPGLPLEISDALVASLIQHSALNQTTLATLKHCQVPQLDLANARGVTDQWLETYRPDNVFYGNFEDGDYDTSSDHDHDDQDSMSSFLSAMETDDAKLPAQPTFGSSVASCWTTLDVRNCPKLTDRGLLQLMQLQSLETARLDQCHALTGRGLLVFSHSSHLRTLSLANCRRLTDEGLVNISELYSLEQLNLDGCRCLTDCSLYAISDLLNLTHLDLSQCDLLTDEGVAQLEHLEQLRELSLAWCRQITDSGVQSLASHSNRSFVLRSLRLARTAVTDAGVQSLAQLSALEELDLNGCGSISSVELGKTLKQLEHLSVLDVSYCPGILRSSWQGKCSNLRSLELCWSGVKDSHLVKFTNLYNLEDLNLDSCPVGDNAMAHLADREAAPNLKSLNLADSNLTDAGMSKIAKFTKLQKLSLFYCNISNRGLRHIAKLTDLQVLNLDSRDITDDGLAHLKNLKKLQSLDVFSGRITDSGCGHISKIQSLESLELCGGGVGDLGCTLLAGLENLQSLNLSQNERISNRGAAALATLSNLRALNLSNTSVDSTALRFFSGLLKLQSLAMYGCDGIDQTEVVGKLQNGLPNLKCLRLNTSNDEDGMVLTDDETSESFPAFPSMEEDDSFFSDQD